MFRILLPLLVALVLAAPASQGGAEENRTLVFGMSAPFSGPNQGLGIEYFRGVRAGFDELNAQGGAGGWLLDVVALDDGYNPDPCVENTVRLVQDEEVFALFSYVGTPTTTRILPLLKLYADRHAYLLFPLTGAQPLRQPPYGQFVYNLRASYAQETAGLVNHLVASGAENIAVLYQVDAYGRSGWDGVRHALAELDLEMVAEAAYERGTSFAASFTPQVRLLTEANPDAIIIIGTYAASAAFIRDARNAGCNATICTVSFADADNLLRLLLAQSSTSGRDYTLNLIQSQVVPSYEDMTLPAVRSYRRAMDRSGESALHGAPAAEGYIPSHFSFVSFEGYLNAMALAAVIEQMADAPDPERIPEAFARLDSLDLGLGGDARFGPGVHQGLTRVYFTTIAGGRIVPMEQWEAADQ